MRFARYLARPPIANNRLQELPDGRLASRFEQAWRDGDGRGEAAWFEIICSKCKSQLRLIALIKSEDVLGC